MTNNTHSSQNKPGTSRTEDLYAKQVAAAGSQEELEQIASAQLKQRMHRALAPVRH